MHPYYISKINWADVFGMKDQFKFMKELETMRKFGMYYRLAKAALTAMKKLLNENPNVNEKVK